jgi:hypothetical protein
MRKITVGSTLDFSTVVSGYPASAGWTLKYRLVPRAAGPTPITLTAVAEGDAYRVQVAPAITATWIAGEYTSLPWVEKVGARYELETEPFTLLPDPATVTSIDLRSSAVRWLDALRATRVKFAESGQNQYLEISIGDKTKKFKDEADLIIAIKRAEFEVSRETTAARLAAGLGSKNVIWQRG